MVDEREPGPERRDRHRDDPVEKPSIVAGVRRGRRDRLLRHAVLGSQQAEHPAQILERGPAGGLDRPERRHRRTTLTAVAAFKPVPRGPGLHRDHRQRV